MARLVPNHGTIVPSGMSPIKNHVHRRGVVSKMTIQFDHHIVGQIIQFMTWAIVLWLRTRRITCLHSDQLIYIYGSKH